MASENETVAEIVREMNCSHEGMIAFEFQNYASRIEAAHQREVAELRECISDMRSWFRLYFSCSSYPNRAQCTGCRFGSCPYHRWRKALEGAKDEGK